MTNNAPITASNASTLGTPRSAAATLTAKQTGRNVEAVQFNGYRFERSPMTAEERAALMAALTSLAS